MKESESAPSGVAVPAPGGEFKRRLRPALTVVSLAFVGWAIWDLARRWQGMTVEVSASRAVLAAVPLLVGALVQAIGWVYLIERMSAARVPRLGALGLYLESQLARYVPGKVGLPLVRMAGAPRIGVAASTIGTSVLIEMLSWTAVGTTVGFALLTLTSQHARGAAALFGQVGPVLVVLALLGMGLGLVIDRRRLPEKLRAMLKLQGKGPLLPPVLLLFHLVYWVTWGTHGVLVTWALGGTVTLGASMAGLFVLAPVAGFVVLAAPAGLGVREAVLALGLAPTLGPAAAIAAAVLSRSASLVADLGTWLLSRPWAGRGAL